MTAVWVTLALLGCLAVALAIVGVFLVAVWYWDTLWGKVPKRVKEAIESAATFLLLALIALVIVGGVGGCAVNAYIEDMHHHDGICADGWHSHSAGSGRCSYHGGD